MKCGFCRAEIEEDSIFCMECGNKQPAKEILSCNKCGWRVAPDEEYCISCGTRLTHETRQEPCEIIPQKVDKMSAKKEGPSVREVAAPEKKGTSKKTKPIILTVLSILLLAVASYAWLTGLPVQKLADDSSGVLAVQPVLQELAGTIRDRDCRDLQETIAAVQDWAASKGLRCRVLGDGTGFLPEGSDVFVIMPMGSEPLAIVGIRQDPPHELLPNWPHFLVWWAKPNWWSRQVAFFQELAPSEFLPWEWEFSYPMPEAAASGRSGAPFLALVYEYSYGGNAGAYELNLISYNEREQLWLPFYAFPGGQWVLGVDDELYQDIYGLAAAGEIQGYDSYMEFPAGDARQIRETSYLWMAGEAHAQRGNCYVQRLWELKGGQYALAGVPRMEINDPAGEIIRQVNNYAARFGIGGINWGQPGYGDIVGIIQELVQDRARVLVGLYATDLGSEIILQRQPTGYWKIVEVNDLTI